MLVCNLSAEERRTIFDGIEHQRRISASAVEKDWWVTIVLRALFTSEYAPYMVFKGGTSLSKGWRIIERFSEDVDIAIDREFLGYGGNLTKNQINDKLRRASCHFVRENLSEAIKHRLSTLGVSDQDFTVTVQASPVSTVDPEKIYIVYKSVYPGVTTYTQNRVLIEAGARSLMTPCEHLPIQSFVGEAFPSEEFADIPLLIPVADARRTFLEKAFLLHEEFHKPSTEIRNDRMSRHLYDLERMMNTEVAHKAMRDKALYRDVVEHRRHFIGLKAFDYDSLYPKSLNFLPPESVRSEWEKDYRVMRDSIIYGPSLDFPVLIERIATLNEQFKALEISPHDAYTESTMSPIE